MVSHHDHHGLQPRRIDAARHGPLKIGIRPSREVENIYRYRCVVRSPSAAHGHNDAPVLDWEYQSHAVRTDEPTRSARQVNSDPAARPGRVSRVLGPNTTSITITPASSLLVREGWRQHAPASQQLQPGQGRPAVKTGFEFACRAVKFRTNLAVGTP